MRDDIARTEAIVVPSNELFAENIATWQRVPMLLVWVDLPQRSLELIVVLIHLFFQTHDASLPDESRVFTPVVDLLTCLLRQVLEVRHVDRLHG